MNKHFFSLLLMGFFALSLKATPGNQFVTQTHDANEIIVPVGGNTWSINGGSVNNKGLTNWTSTATKVHTYVYLTKTGTLHLSLNMNPGGKNKLKITVHGISKEVIVEGVLEQAYYVG
jgi:hypothetical protein